jgi:hypothetical protein
VSVALASDRKVARDGGVSGIMRGMNDPENKPAPALPWYRAIVTRTRRGESLRRRVLIGLALCAATLWFGLRGKLSVFTDHCYGDSGCDWRTCRYGRALCLLPLDQPDGAPGRCVCRQPPAGCREPRLKSEHGFEWECSGESVIDGGEKQEGGP